MLTASSRAESPAKRVAPLKILGDDAPDKLLVHEIYRSLQGESTWAGVPCTFVRLTGCHLRCAWCDTEHAFAAGEVKTIDEVVAAVAALAVPLVELTGGEPLLQKAAPKLLTRLLDAGHTVLVETSGALSIAGLDPRLRLIVDVKPPSSGEQARNRPDNLPLLKPGKDELKLVVVDDADWAFARDFVATAPVPAGVTILLSPGAMPGPGTLGPRGLVDRLLADPLMLQRVRFQLQMHKVLWGEQTGV
jgi:7-carboxy-7-deazaguanine synthase